MDNILTLYFCSAPIVIYDQATWNLVAGSNLEKTIQQIMGIGSSSCDRESYSCSLSSL